MLGSRYACNAGRVGEIRSRDVVIGLSPTTEGNLGDGIFPAASFLERRDVFGIASDSNVSIDVAEELRRLEYAQRLSKRRRAVLVSKEIPSVGDFLYRNALLGGARALRQPIGAFEAGARADIAVRDVMVGGTWVVCDHRHPAEEEARFAYQRVLGRVVN